MRTATFESTVDILVKAYLNDTLVHNNCYACAVGNIIADVCDYKFEPCIDSPEKRKIVWEGVGGKYFLGDADYIPNWYDFLLSLEVESGTEKVRKEITDTGYSCEQLVLIERSFERSPRGNNNDEWMFNGLMAVVDVLASIHNVDLSIKENAKLLFVKSPN